MTIGDALRTMISEQLWRWKVAQLFDTTVDPIDALGTGIIAKTGTGPSTYAARTITDDVWQTLVTQGNGVSGDPTISLRSSYLAGWIKPTNVGLWTRVSGNTIGTPAGADSIYSKGDKIRLWNSGSYLYNYIVSVSSTQLVLAGDGVPASLDLSLNDYSKVQSPVGFPGKFLFSPVCTGFTGSTTGKTYYSIDGVKLSLAGQFGVGTSNGAGFTASLPVAASSDTGGYWFFGGIQGNDNSVYQSTITATISAGNTSVTFNTSGGTGGWTAANSKNANAAIWYLI